MDITVRFLADGSLLPLTIHWNDSRSFEIDRITDIRQAASLKTGGQGLGYTVLIIRKQRYLFLEFVKLWFIGEGENDLLLIE